MKRFLLFSGQCYYAMGGWDDFRGDFDTLEEADAAELKIPRTSYHGNWWFHIVDTEAKSIVASGDERLPKPPEPPKEPPGPKLRKQFDANGKIVWYYK